MYKIKPRKFNTTDLAVYQDCLISDIKHGKLSDSDKVEAKAVLSDNFWFRMARYFAPGNLVVRQYCLLDLLDNKANNAAKIIHQVKVLTYFVEHNKYTKFNTLLWSEGYSYWLYTKAALELWIVMFPEVSMEVLGIVNQVDRGFSRSGYKYNNRYYPAPFGDIPDIAMDIIGTEDYVIAVGLERTPSVIFADGKLVNVDNYKIKGW